MRPWRLLLALAVSAATIGVGVTASGATAPYAGATPGTRCDAGSLPEKVQGRAPKSDVASGRYARGYTCNAKQISHQGSMGGYRVERYVDAAGHECGFYDSTLLFPTSVPDQREQGPGVYVLDMRNPAKPVLTDTLKTPAMLSPHESLRLNTKRGLLAAVQSTPASHLGFVDVYDVSKDCLHPTLKSSTPMGILGHEGGFSPDGMTYWVASLYLHTLAAVDVSDPAVPKIVYFSYAYQPHGVSLSDDGKTLFMAEAAFDDSGSDFSGLTVLDVSKVQARVPNPPVTIISRLTWKNVSTPQNATPFTRRGHRYVLETDEFGKDDAIGAARIVDEQNIRKPFVVSNLRLAVDQPKAQGADLDADPGNDQQFQGYQGHYCSLPSRVDPTVIACSFI
ncbi:MAG: hypothetical protein M3P04_01160, partial [Actinomycetota bacterium]|nr:hypothetical protein [Actinomycetota bacterium]